MNISKERTVLTLCGLAAIAALPTIRKTACSLIPARYSSMSLLSGER